MEVRSDLVKHVHLSMHPPNGTDAQREVLHPADHSNEIWINYVVRDATEGHIVGRLEATIHAPVAEVAFLYGPAYWGRGYATRGLLWLHELLFSHPTQLQLWATTVPANKSCQALLRRCGYAPVEIASAPHLLSYDPGDLVFRGPCQTSD